MKQPKSACFTSKTLGVATFLYHYVAVISLETNYVAAVDEWI